MGDNQDPCIEVYDTVREGGKSNAVNFVPIEFSVIGEEIDTDALRSRTSTSVALHARDLDSVASR